MDLNQVVTAFKDAGWSGTVYPNLKVAMTNVSNAKSFWCGYWGYLRRVRPEVCKWHKSKNDLQCEGCRNSATGY